MSLDGAGRFDSDLSCVQCGHNLRGLLPTGECGECGSPVELSMGGGPLAAISLVWTGRARWGIGTMTLLLPWLWLPLVWPAAWVACWCMTEADPAPGRRGEWIAVTMRIFLILLPVPICIWLGVALIESWPWELSTHGPACLVVTAAFLLCALLAAMRLSTRVGAKDARRMLWIVFWCWVFGPPAAMLLGLGRFGAGSYVTETQVIGVLGLLALLSTPVLFPIALIRLWREFEAAEVLAHGGRSRINVWAGWPTSPPGATPPADAAAGSRAGA
jgi:hypothetical protein